MYNFEDLTDKFMHKCSLKWNSSWMNEWIIVVEKVMTFYMSYLHHSLANLATMSCSLKRVNSLSSRVILVPPNSENVKNWTLRQRDQCILWIWNWWCHCIFWQPKRHWICRNTDFWTVYHKILANCVVLSNMWFTHTLIFYQRILKYPYFLHIT